MRVRAYRPKYPRRSTSIQKWTSRGLILAVVLLVILSFTGISSFFSGSADKTEPTEITAKPSTFGKAAIADATGKPKKEERIEALAEEKRETTPLPSSIRLSPEGNTAIPTAQANLVTQANDNEAKPVINLYGLAGKPGQTVPVNQDGLPELPPTPPVLDTGAGFSHENALAAETPTASGEAPHQQTAQTTDVGSLLTSTLATVRPEESTGIPGAPQAATELHGQRINPLELNKDLHIADSAKPAPPPAVEKHGNLWGQPFVGYSLEEIATIEQQKYTAVTPSKWGERIPGITSSLAVKDFQKKYALTTPVVALTLDACDGKKDESFDADIIAFLKKNNIPATIFVTSKWITTNKQTFIALAEDPLFEIGAHGKTHKPASVNGRSIYGIKGTGSFLELVQEVEGNARDIQRLSSKRPLWFRSGTAFYDNVAVAVIKDLELNIAGYSITADEGATLPAQTVAKRILSAKNGDIILCHLNHPKSGTRNGILEAVPQLLQKGYTFVRLSDIIQ